MPEIGPFQARTATIPLRQMLDFIPAQHGESQSLSLAEQVYEYILLHVVFPQPDSTVAYGGKITEAQLAAQTGVSNGPIREALFRLRREGWIETVGNRGSFLRDFSDRRIAREIYRFRLTLETGAFYTLARDISTPQLAYLKELLYQMGRAMETGDLIGFRRADIGFHLSVIEFAGGRPLGELYRPKLLQWYAMSHHILCQSMSRGDLQNQMEAPGVSHHALYDALAGHDPAAAATNISGHFAFIAGLIGLEPQGAGPLDEDT